jgi:hypothetical protein
MSSFTDGKPFIATEQDCNANWAAGRKGQYFRCALCGYKFKVGDVVRWQYTNDVPDSCGNPLVCQTCDGDKKSIVDRIIAMRNEIFADKYWWVLKIYVGED